jgi:hypothetical protein
MRPASLPLALAALAGGCALPTSPVPPTSPQAEAVEQARRDERLRIMQAYWYDHTLSPAGEAGPAAPDAPLEYPAGTYSGIRFGPRLAPDPSLAEPDR